MAFKVFGGTEAFVTAPDITGESDMFLFVNPRNVSCDSATLFGKMTYASRALNAKERGQDEHLKAVTCDMLREDP